MAALEAVWLFLEMGLSMRWLFSPKYREELRNEEDPVRALLQETLIIAGVGFVALPIAIVLVGGIWLAVSSPPDWGLLWDYMRGMPRAGTVP